jgi:hypothetical protein
VTLHAPVTLAAVTSIEFRCYVSSTASTASATQRTFSAQQFTNLTVQ